MKHVIKPENPLTDKACKEQTGRTLKEWFSHFDSHDGLKIGRRKLLLLLREEKQVPPDWWCATLPVEYEMHHDQRKKDGNFEGYFICSTKTISAPVPEVYKAWTDNASLAKWLGPKAKADVKEDGSFSTADGDKGTFKRIRPDKDLRFSWEHADYTDGSLVDVQFQDKGKGKTGLLVNHTRIQKRAEADGLRNAWAGALEKLKGLLEG